MILNNGVGVLIWMVVLVVGGHRRRHHGGGGGGWWWRGRKKFEDANKVIDLLLHGQKSCRS